MRYRKNNPEQEVVRGMIKRQVEINSSCKWRNIFYMNEAYKLAKLRTEKTGIKWHVDHIVPLKSKIVCGLHNEFNIRVIDARSNIVNFAHFLCVAVFRIVRHMVRIELSSD